MFAKSLDTILNTFTKVSADLDSFIARETAASEKLRSEAAVKVTEADGKDAQVSRAHSVKEKIAALIN